MIWGVVQNLTRLTLLPWAVFTHDVFIFGFGTSFLDKNLDLPILKLFRKKIIFQFHGSDSRPPYLDGAIMSSLSNLSIESCIKLTKERKRSIHRIEKYADVCINNPPHGQFHERPFVNWLRVGLPVKPPIVNENMSTPPLSNEVIRILHCPSDPEAKGSGEIEAAISELMRQGYKINFVEIVGQPNSVVLDELSRCDLVVDQLYADYGMPGFATEAAWYGKPVVIAGYAVDYWAKAIPPEIQPPTFYCSPDNLHQTLLGVVRNGRLRTTMGHKAQHFVESLWCPNAVAQRYIQLAKGVIPENWFEDPQQINYYLGAGISKMRLRTLLHDFIEKGGVSSLQLQDKPELRMKIVEFAQSSW